MHREFTGQGKVIFPQGPDYGVLNSYYTPVAQQAPSCIFNPLNTADVAQAVKLFTSNSCPFAIRGGGHNFNPGWASINNGVLVSMNSLNRVNFYPGFNTAVVEAGSRWKNVYDTLSAYDVTVVGGQNSHVGVSGYLLGGGISFLSNIYGWGADNIKGYQLVLADGRIVDANEHENPDLFRSLKGGSSNFGIVTAFSLATVRMDKFTAAGIYYPESSVDALLKALYTYCVSSVDADPKSQVVASFGLDETPKLENGILVTYFGAMDLSQPPAVLKPFASEIPGADKQSLVANGTLGNMGDTLASLQISGRRTLRHTMSIIPDLALMKKLREIWVKTSAEYKDVAGFKSNLDFQPIGKKWIAAGVARGGNSMGIDSPIIAFWEQAFWKLASDDKRMEEYQEKLIAQFEEAAKAVGKLSRFRYMNYSGRKQDAISHYGPDSVKAMTQVKKKFDPKNVFGTLVPGGFKIPGI
ncbi:hypothetical protein ABW20_dc0103573 [Dactylellina cionopaga]|nr:hypothetical protein ABW20_dc0103573 [Dactylellina cionopaga]